MPSELAPIVLLAPIAFLGAFVYGVTGFGAGLLTIPLASHFYAMPFVLAVFAVLDSVNAIRVCLTQPRAIVRAEALRLVPCCVLGVLLGVGILLLVPAGVLMLALGLFVLAYALSSLLVSAAMPTISPRWAYLVGVSGGIASARSCTSSVRVNTRAMIVGSALWTCCVTLRPRPSHETPHDGPSIAAFRTWL